MFTRVVATATGPIVTIYCPTRLSQSRPVKAPVAISVDPITTLIRCVVSLARLRPVRGRWTRVKHVTNLTGLDEAFHHSWYQRKAVVMADRRDWGGGGDDPEESTQRIIERIWESLTDIRMRMDQQAPVPPVIGEAVPVAPVPPPPGVEVPFVDQYHHHHPAVGKKGAVQQGRTLVLEYQMRFMALSRYAPYVFTNNAMMVEYFIRGLRPELQTAVIPLMCRTIEEAAQRANTLERAVRTRQVGASGSGSFRLPQQSAGVSKGKASAGPSSSGFSKWGQKLKHAFKGKGRGWGGRQQIQQGRGKPEVEESQQSTARQPILPPGYRCYNCNQPGHLIRNCPYPREYGYGRGV
ncbi:hypothetical protein Taro_012212 [Colocasia esculenta]|uniref:CCHC-type domain-containing protein n=1 Tax=Colocasia esculenta TaxID=4460 RepID=A0A843UCW2_COLES|nr:hypothetical protein [Colocasia esculenta]